MRISFVVLFNFFSVTTFASVDFNYLYQQALDKNENIQSKIAEIEVSELNKSKAWSSMAPSLKASYVHTKQQIPDSVRSSGLSIREDQVTSSLNLKQPIFQGGAEYFGLQASEVLINKAKTQLNEQKRQLYIELSQAFYNYLALESDNKNNQKLLESVSRRVEEIRKRASIGRSNPADLLSSQAQLSQLKANLNLTITQAQNLKQNIYELTGQMISEDIKDNLNIPKQTADLSYWESQLMKRADVSIQRQTLKLSELQKTITKTKHMPKVNVEGIYYFERTGSFYASDWSLSLNLSVPIFEGGQTYFETKQNTQEIMIQQLNLNNTIRKAKVSLKNQYNLTKALIKQVGQYQQTLKLSERAYKQQMKDYKSGLISYLEASQAERDYFEIVKAESRQKLELKKQYLILKAQAGVIE